jgi:hypothetical protein
MQNGHINIDDKHFIPKLTPFLGTDLAFIIKTYIIQGFDVIF